MLELQKFILKNENWRELLAAPPFSLKIQEKGSLVLFKYSQIDSDFSEPICCEARGIILEKDTWKVVKKAFGKFFNLGESHAAQIDWATATATLKMDGSLISLYYYNNEWNVATNGMIDAHDAELQGPGYRNFYDLAAAAFRKFNLDFSKLNKNCTYTFEVCSPANRVVLYYPELFLFHLLTVNNATLEEVEEDIGIPKPQKFVLNCQADYQSLVDSFDETKEGIVIRDARARRVKLKTPLYFELHRMAGNGSLTFERALHLVRTNEVEEFISYFTQYKDYLDRVEKTYREIQKLLEQVDFEVKDFKEKSNNASRKEFAQWVLSKNSIPALYFKSYDGEDLKKFVENLTDTTFIKLFKLKEEQFYG